MIPLLRPGCLPIAVLALLGLGGESSARIWTQAATGRTIDAEFVKRDGAVIHLRMASGSVVQVPVGDLVPADIAFLDQLAGGRPEVAPAPPPAPAPAAPGPLDKTAVREWKDAATGQVIATGTLRSVYTSEIRVWVRDGKTRKSEAIPFDRLSLDDQSVVRDVILAEELKRPVVPVPTTNDEAVLKRIGIDTSRSYVNRTATGRLVGPGYSRDNVVQRTVGMRSEATISVPFGFRGELSLVWGPNATQQVVVDFEPHRALHEAVSKAAEAMASSPKPLDGAAATRLAAVADSLRQAAKAFQDFDRAEREVSQKLKLFPKLAWYCEVKNSGASVPAYRLSTLARLAEEAGVELARGPTPEAVKKLQELRQTTESFLSSLNAGSNSNVAFFNDALWSANVEPVFASDEAREVELVVRVDGREVARKLIKRDTVRKIIQQ